MKFGRCLECHGKHPVQPVLFFFFVCVPFSSVGAARGVKNAPVHMARDTAGTRPCP